MIKYWEIIMEKNIIFLRNIFGKNDEKYHSSSVYMYKKGLFIFRRDFRIKDNTGLNYII